MENKPDQFKSNAEGTLKFSFPDISFAQDTVKVSSEGKLEGFNSKGSSPISPNPVKVDQFSK